MTVYFTARKMMVKIITNLFSQFSCLDLQLAVGCSLQPVALETERMIAVRHKGEDGLATATKVPSTNPYQPQTIFPPQVVQLCQVVNSFMTLTKEEKLSYLQLKDVFDYLNKPDDFPIDVNTIDVAIFKEIICTSREAAARVWGIFNTNQLQGRLALGVNRVFSC